MTSALPPPIDAEGLNDAQRAALSTDRDLLVDAGAGAGKTRVLALRWLAIIEAGLAEIQQIVAFTFTEKAAGEMRERVQSFLGARIRQLDAHPDREQFGPELQRLRKARADFHRNRIGTVHGFCLRLLREYAWEADLEPGVPVLDEHEQQRAISQAVRRVLFGDDHQPLTDALARLGARVPLFSLQKTLRKVLEERDRFLPAMERTLALWKNEPDEIRRRREEYEARMGDAFEPALEVLRGLPFAAAPDASVGDHLAGILHRIAPALQPPLADRFDSIKSALLTSEGKARSFAGKTGGSKTKWKNAPEALEQAREGLNRAAGLLAKHLGRLGKYRFDEDHERRCASVMRDLYTVAIAAAEAWRDECAGALDFLEFELRALQLLQNPETGSEARHGLRYFMIDEFQDTNPLQAKLFDLLLQGDVPPGGFFAVGDAKQSIYRFRGSDVRVFRRAEEQVEARNRAAGRAIEPLAPPWGLACQDDDGRRLGVVRMAVNYRTVAPVLETGNRLFACVFASDAPLRDDEAPAQRMEAGCKDKSEVETSVRLTVLKAPEGPRKKQEESEGDGETTETDIRPDDEAELVADAAEALLAEAPPEKRFTYRDIAVLVRAGTKNESYRAAFARRGLPLFVPSQGGLLASPEVGCCMNLLEVLARPEDDLAALGALRSPAGGVSDAGLTRLALQTGSERPLLVRLREHLGLLDAQDAEAARRFLGKIDLLRRSAGFKTPSVLLSDLLAEFSPALAVSCGRQGEQRLANLERFLSLVREMQERVSGLTALLRELRTRLREEADESQGVPAENADGIRLMTVHASKGMEFEAVIVPNLGRAGGPPDAGLLRVTPDEGALLGLWLPTPLGPSRGQTLPDWEGVKAAEVERARDDAEEKRVLYVAYTRAKKRVELIGTAPRGEWLGNAPGATWLERVLHAVGCNEFGGETEDLPAGFALRWADRAPRRDAISHEKELRVLDSAARSGALSLAEIPEFSLAGPLALPETETEETVFRPEAIEFGTLVHAEIERRLRTTGTDRSPLRLEEIGMARSVDPSLAAHADRAMAALRTLGPAEFERPEWGFAGADGREVRLDLLRVLPGDVYEIVDFKTDDVAGDDLPRYARERHGRQLADYADRLREYLSSRGRKAREIRLWVCFTSPESLSPAARLARIPE